MNTDILLHPFTLGFLLGLVFVVIALYHVLRLKGDLKRLRQHLQQKLEIEADALSTLRQERDDLRKQNEHLRVGNSALREKPERRGERELEVFSRAERKLMVAVPGFAGPWENAKEEARRELDDEESGRKLPERLRRFFGGAKPGDEQKTLPSESQPSSLLPPAE